MAAKAMRYVGFVEALLHGAVDALLPLLHTLQNILEHQQLTFPVDLRMLLFQARSQAVSWTDGSLVK